MKQTLTVDEIARSSDHVTVDGMLKAIDIYNKIKSTEAILTTPKVAEELRSLTTESLVNFMSFPMWSMAVYVSDKVPEGEILMGSRQQILAKLREYEGVTAEVKP